MSKNKFMPSRELAREFRKIYSEDPSTKEERDAYFKSGIKQSLVHGNLLEYLLKFTNYGRKKYISAILEENISIYASSYLTEVSNNGEFNPVLLNWFEESLEVPKTKKDFYKKLHDEFFQYVKNGGQIPQWGKLRITQSGDGIEIYDIKEPKVPKLDELDESRWI